MKWFRNLKLMYKLFILIFVGIVSLSVVGYTGYFYLLNSKEQMAEVYAEKLLPVKWINENAAHSRATNSNILEMMLTVDQKHKQQLRQDIQARGELFNKNFEMYQKINLSTYEKDKIKEVQAVVAVFREARNTTIELALQNRNTEAYDVYIKEVRPELEKYTEILTDIAEYNAKSAEEIGKQNDMNFSKAKLVLSSVSVGAIVVLFLLGWIITRVITVPLNTAAVFLDTFATGDLSPKLSNFYLDLKDEFGILARSCSKMSGNIRNLIKQLSNTSEQLAASSEELTASADQSAKAVNSVADSISEVANGAAQQLNTVDEAVNIVKEMSDGLTEVAGNAESVSAFSERTAAAVHDGEKSMQTAIKQMTAIEKTVEHSADMVIKLGKRSQEIGQIVDAIAKIAGQTNLLALNAAIEAARAGEQGRGFAVVAEEVRKLAEQSQEAAKQIADLIREIQSETEIAVVAMQEGTREVKIGTEVVNDTSVTFREIMDFITQMSLQVREISTSIDKISGGSQKVFVAVQDINSVSKNTASQTQTVSAIVEEQAASMQEIAASSESLAKLAEELRNNISFFKL